MMSDFNIILGAILTSFVIVSSVSLCICCLFQYLKQKDEAEQKQAEQKKEEQTITYPNKMRLNLEVEKAIEDKLFERFEERLNPRLEALESMVEKLRSHKDCAISSLKALEKKIEELEKKVEANAEYEQNDTRHCLKLETDNFVSLDKRIAELEKRLRNY